MTNDARAALDALGWPSSHVVGHTMSGIVAADEIVSPSAGSRRQPATHVVMQLDPLRRQHVIVDGDLVDLPAGATMPSVPMGVSRSNLGDMLS